MTGRPTGTTPRRSPASWRVITGALVGAVAGAVVAVNIVIFSGIERGYETPLPQIFEENAVVGVITVLVLLAGPLIGATWVLRRGRAATMESSVEERTGERESPPPR